TFSEGLVLRSMISAQEKNYAAAIADMEKVLKQDPDSIQWNLQLGGYLSSSGRPRKAVELFTVMVEKNPKSWECRRARADTLLTISEHKQAVADYEIALKEQPKHSGMLNNLAWVLATCPTDEMRNGKRAVELATAACEGTKYEAAHILSTLAAAYAETGDFKTAKKWSKKAVELGGDDEVSEQLKKELESYQNEKPWRESQKTDEKPGIKPSNLET
ncbi:MAG: tetratricopeptide (TPR) repeat protein, partial [Pirellulaceae bacterium]